MKKKSRVNMLRHAFVCSVMSLLLCCAMLIGTTYAWLNDSVSSAENRIIAGNFGVTLYRYEKYMDGSYQYEDITNGKEPLFTGTWEPGTEKELYFAVENKGTLDLKYEIGLIVRDGGLADMLEYSIVSMDTDETALLSVEDDQEEDVENEDTEDEGMWTSLASNSNAEDNSRIQYVPIVEERILYKDEPDTEHETAEILILTEDSEIDHKIDHYKLVLKMNSFEDKDHAKQYQNTACEIDLRVIANQYVEDESIAGEQYEDESYQNLKEFTSHIYHMTVAELSATALSEDEEPEMEYCTSDTITAISKDKTIRFEFPEGVLIDNPDEKTEAVIFVNVAPDKLPEEILLEEDQTSQSIRVQLTGISEENAIPYTMTWQMKSEDPLAAIICSDESGDEIYPVEEMQSTDDQNESAFVFKYNEEEQNVAISYTKSATFTFVFETEETEEDKSDE